MLKESRQEKNSDSTPLIPATQRSELRARLQMNWTSDEHLLTLNSNQEEIFFGAVYGTCAFFQLPLYAMVMLILYQKDRKQANMTYKLMNLINFFEASQVLGHFVTFPILIFPVLQVRLDRIIRIFACTMNTFWLAELPLMTILAFSRILIFCEIIRFGKMHLGIKLAVGIVLTWTSFVLIVSCITGNMTFFSPVWGYDHEVPSATVFETLELYVSLPSLALSYMFYLIIIVEIYKRKKMTSSVKSRKNEIAILLQYTFVNTYMTVLIALFHEGDMFLDMTNPRVLASMNTAWICWSYLNPVMLLILNKTIRQECQALFGVGPVLRNQSSVISISKT